jgi:hypothetical protein
MAGGSKGDRQETATARAQLLIRRALDLLDAHGGSPGAAAHLELALQDIERELGAAR